MRFSNYGLWLARLFGINFPPSKIEARLAIWVREHLKYEADLTFKRAWETEAVFSWNLVYKIWNKNLFLYYFYFQNTKANPIEYYDYL